MTAAETPQGIAASRVRLGLQHYAFADSLRVRGLAPATIAARSQALATFLSWLTETSLMEVSNITQEHLCAYERWLSIQSFAPATLQMKVIAVHSFFQFLVSVGALTENTAANLRSPKAEDRLPRTILTRSQARRILSVPDARTKKGLRDRAILELFYSTGLRCEEMARLSVHDVDQTGFIRVWGKGAKERMVPAGAKSIDAIREYLTVARRRWSENRPDEFALWLSAIHPHQPLTKQTIAVTAQKHAEAAGVAHSGRTHIWRHTCATHLIASGANVAYVQQLLGHRSLQTTQRYTRVAPVEIRAMQARSHPRSLAPVTPSDPTAIVRWR